MTTLTDLVRALPNGLHDAELRTLSVDLGQGSLVMNLNVWVGDMDDASRREAYRPAKLILHGVRYFVIDPPGPGAAWLPRSSIRIDVGFEPPRRAVSSSPEPPPGAFAFWLFLDELNSFMHTIAEGATLEWQGEEP